MPKSLSDGLQNASKNQPTESIYLQTSKGIYETGEDLWFKGYVLNNQYLTPSKVGKTLYVRLVEEIDRTIVWQEKYKIENGFVDGHVFVQDTLKTGNYFLEACTANSFFDNNKDIKAIRNLKIVERITSFPKDSVETKEPYLETQDSIHLGVFPEGGNLISGLQNLVAFKAVNQKGEPAKVSGALYENDKKILDIKTVHAGMGSFSISADSAKKYYIKLDAPFGKGVYTLPPILATGKTLRLVSSSKDALIINVLNSKFSKNEIVYVRLQIRGVVYSIAKTLLEDSSIIKIPLKDVPQGIGEVTLFDQDLKPVAERLVYVKQNQKLYITTELDKPIYLTKEKAELKIKVTDQFGQPTVAHLGLSVYDALYKNIGDAKTIESHYNLSTQLKGKLYDPSYYFNKENANRKQALNLLLLTQGWRNYVWGETILQNNPPQYPAITDEVKGKLVGLKKRKDSISSSLVIVYDPFQEDNKAFVLADEQDNFVLTSEHLKMGRRLFVKHFENKKEKIQVMLENPFKTIDKIQRNKKYEYPLPLVETGKLKEEPTVYERKSISEGIFLEEVTVETKRKHSHRDKYLARLDSLANLEMTTDYVGVPCGGLNCPIHTKDRSKKPIEGREYKYMEGFEWINEDKKIYKVADNVLVKYRYPKLTEAYLMDKFNITRVEGYYPKKIFYEPVYDKAEQINGFPDYRNTLYWKPDIVTDKNGEASLSFYCSDINATFNGTIEGVSGEGLLGNQNFEFFVRNRK